MVTAGRCSVWHLYPSVWRATSLCGSRERRDGVSGLFSHHIENCGRGLLPRNASINSRGLNASAESGEYEVEFRCSEGQKCHNYYSRIFSRYSISV